MDEIGLLLNDYRLTTVEILYRMPDHPDLLQTFVWQDYDRAPDYPRLAEFLDFWSDRVDADLHSVSIAQAGPSKPACCLYSGASLALH